MNTVRMHITAIDLAEAQLPPDQWCHVECYQRWVSRPEWNRRFIGGHIHFDEQKQAWTVPDLIVPLGPIERVKLVGSGRRR